ncbi:MAG: hypothetical protein DRQ54_07495 [Gammaproteobacteria bacterium]|nr:MAG: hypothetical protein DRQ54_07495 [Gammaproteobacteria bacterium]
MRGGWEVKTLNRKRRTVGSHNTTLIKDGFLPMIVVSHSELRVGTLSKYVNHAGLTIDEFLALLGRKKG